MIVYVLFTSGELLIICILSPVGWLVVFTSHRQRGHLETAPNLLSLAKDVKLGFYTSHRESNPGPSRGSPLFVTSKSYI